MKMVQLQFEKWRGLFRLKRLFQCFHNEKKLHKQDFKNSNINIYLSPPIPTLYSHILSNPIHLIPIPTPMPQEENDGSQTSFFSDVKFILILLLN